MKKVVISALITFYVFGMEPVSELISEVGLSSEVGHKSSEPFFLQDQQLLDNELLRAVSEGNSDTLSKNLELGANINAGDKMKNNAAHIASTKGYLDILRYLDKKKFNFNAKNINGFTPLHQAVMNKQNEAIKYLAKISDINAPDFGGWTALHWAARNHDEISAFLLLINGANINAVDKKGNTALHWAVQNYADEVFDILMDFNANDVIPNNDGFTASHIEKAQDFNLLHKSMNNLLLSGAEQGDIRKVYRALKEGADIDVLHHGFTPLIIAVWNGHAHIAEYLINQGASITHADNSGCTAFDWATRSGFDQLAAYLKAVEQKTLK